VFHSKFTVANGSSPDFETVNYSLKLWCKIKTWSWGIAPMNSSKI